MNKNVKVCVYDNHTMYEIGMKKFEFETVSIYDPQCLKYWQSLYNIVRANDKDFKPLEWLSLSPGQNNGYFHMCDGLTKEQFISEFKKRYLFLQKNYLFLLAPLIREETDSLYEKRRLDCQMLKVSFVPGKQIYIGIDKYLFSLIENFMFYYKPGNDGWIEKHPLYRKVESLKKNKEYLEEVKRGLSILEKEKQEKQLPDINLSLFDLFLVIRGFVKAEQNFSNVKKLEILDEYFRVSRHGNNSDYWESGFKLKIEDINRNLGGVLNDPCGRNCHPVIYIHGPGCFNNPFIEGFSKMERGTMELPLFNSGRIIGYKTVPDYKKVCSRLSFDDCLDLYLEGHDELLYNLSCNCISDDSLDRPNGTNPCLSNFKVIEDNIFCLEDNFYHLCSECGYIVNVSEKITNPRIRKRIKDRCSEDVSSFKKHFLLSELYSLDKDYKVLLKK